MSLPALIILARLLGAPADTSTTEAPSRPLAPMAPAPSDTTAMFIASPSPFSVETRRRAVPTPLQAALASLVLPGAGQWWTGHPVRGTILFGLDLWIYGDAMQRHFSSIPTLRDDRDGVVEAVDAEEWRQIQEGDTSATARAALASLRDSLSDAAGRAAISADYARSEIAWALGVHAWGVVDAAESAWLLRGGKRPARSMAGSAWASALVPGLGQILNGHYAKAALLYMGVAGAVVSFDGRQRMVDFWKTESDIARAEGRETGTAGKQADFFRKRRNQYAWGLGLIYVYQIFDAAVDARLSRIDASSPLTLEPSPSGPGLVASFRF